MSEVGPCPLDENRETVAETGQFEDVDEQPEPPREYAGKPPASAEVGDGGVAADGSQISEIAVAELTQRLVAEEPEDVLDGMCPLLHRHLRHSGEHLAILLDEGQVANDVDVLVARHSQVGPHQDATDAIHLDAQRPPQRRGGNAGSPSTVDASIRAPAARVTPRSSMPTTGVSLRTLTPSRRNDCSPRSWRSPGKALRIRGPASTRITCALLVSMLRKSRASE